MKSIRCCPLLVATVAISACATPVQEPAPPDLAIRWVRDAAEYRALSLQAYREAGRALPGKLGDEDWSALPYQVDAAALPPAVILDVDETAVTNVLFQESLRQPFSEDKLNRWSEEHDAVAVPGAAEFVEAATAAGVTVFFVTNRACVASAGDPCPQEQVVIGDLAEAGFRADESTVLLARERTEWTREKGIRRRHIAADYRVIMLFGDDLGDFIDCSRRRPLAPCLSGATRETRYADVDKYADYWGNGWYVLPNPMHGSWTSVQ